MRPFPLITISLILIRLRIREARRVRTMKDIFPDHVETSKEESVKKQSSFVVWLCKQNWLLWGCITGAFIAIYRNFDRILTWF